jgi:Holliday junction resolvase RusA-like endonuclease
MIKFVLRVIPRTKKNHGQIIENPRTGRPMVIPSAAYKKFEKECLPYLRRVKAETGTIDYPINCECFFYMPTRRKVDLPNLLNAIDDAMVKAELIVDDNRDIIAGHDGSRVFYDKENPRIEIIITEINKYAQWSAKE